jgi:methanogenic corrinoid protein MtbC1
LIVLGCAPDERHDLGLLLIHLLLRRRGRNSLYLGQNVPVEQFSEEMARLRPVMVIIASVLAETMPGLIAIGEAVLRMPPPHPIFAYGGRVFCIQPELRAGIPCIFLGESARAAADYVSELVDVAVANNHTASGAPGPNIRVA